MLDKRISEEGLREWREQNQDEELVATNGCFDVIHAGHVKFLSESCMMGDKLIVGLNSDESVKALKGDKRPINSVEHRAMVLSGFYFVDFIYVFKETKATEFLRLAEPEIYTKAGDYSLDTMDKEEKYVLEENESRILFLDFMDGESTTNTLQKIEGIGIYSINDDASITWIDDDHADG